MLASAITSLAFVLGEQFEPTYRSRRGRLLFSDLTENSEWNRPASDSGMYNPARFTPLSSLVYSKA